VPAAGVIARFLDARHRNGCGLRGGALAAAAGTAIPARLMFALFDRR